MTELSQTTEEGLWVTARQLAAQAGFEFTVPCAAIVRDFIRAGVRNMEREGRFSESDTELANTHLSQLVEAMVLATHNLPSKDGARLAPVIREGAVVIAKRICPLWPFC